MEIWNDYHIVHKGINYDEEYKEHVSETLIRDNKTNYDIVSVFGYYSYKTLVFGIVTNEKMIRRLKLPCYKHHADFSYIDGKKYINQKAKKGKQIPCLSLGTGNIGKILKEVIAYWKDNGFTVNSIEVTRETGNTIKKGYRTYKIGDKKK